MTFEIPFNKDIYERQTNLQLNSYWEKTLKKHKKNLYFSIGAILLGILAIYGNGNVGYVFLIIGIYGCIEFYKINTSYQNSKKDFQKITNNEIEVQIESNENSYWEFNEDFFRYKDCKYEAKIKWKTFKSYEIIEDNIFLNLNVGNQSSYILAKEEVGENSFESIINLVDSKIKRTSH